MKKNKKYFGFELKEKKKVKELNSILYFFIHQKTGAEVLFLENGDPDKLFSISFKTPSFDSRGVNHILEHSVLQGSKKYPMKDIFTFLLKNTNSTFINAMTYPDKTTYPVGSLYESELEKLRNVYCDAVFNPLVIKDKSIFQQEKMVVFNEMKGVMSSVDSIIEEETLANLFPDNFYKYNSGGDPQEIIKITHQQLVEHHQKFYQPSNSYTFIYGDADILKHLEYLDKNYFSKYKKVKFPLSAKLNLQSKWKKPMLKNKEYFFLGDNNQKKNIFNISFLTASQKNRRDILGLEILFALLLEHRTSILKKKLLESKIADKIEYQFWTSETIQTVFSLTLKNVFQKDKKKFQEVFFKNLKKIAKQGFSKKTIQSKLKKVEFEIFEQKNQTQKGLIYWEKVTSTWLNNFSITDSLEIKKYFKEIKKESLNNYFEKLIKKYLLNNNNYVFLNFSPTNKNKYENLKFQKTSSKTKIKEKKEIELKPLGVSLLAKKENNGELQIKKDYKNLTFLFLPIKDKEIMNLNFYFDVQAIELEKFQYLKLLVEILPEMFSENFQKEIEENFGFLNFSLKIFSDKKKKTRPKFIISTKFLNKNFSKNKKILESIFEEIKFNKEKIKEKVNSLKNNLENDFISKGHIFTVSIASANLNQKKYLTEEISGFKYYSFLKNLNNFEEVLNNLKEIYKNIFSSKDLIISSAFVTNEFKNIKKIKFLDINFENKKSIEPFVSKSLAVNLPENFVSLKNKNKKIAISTASQIQYNALIADFSTSAIKFDSSFYILEIILKYELLWNIIREKGGAYGAFPIISRDGIFGFVSYRDPRLKKTFEDYQKIIKEIEKIKFSQSEINQFIVKAISSLDIPKTNFEKLILLSERYISQITPEEIQKEREHLLKITFNDFKNFNKLGKILENGNITTIGSEKEIKKNKKLFNKIFKI